MTKLSLRDNFCSSPWFHVRINPAGYYVPCRWASEWRPEDGVTDYHVSEYTIQEYMNSAEMRDFRTNHLMGARPPQCVGCYYEDSHGKLSGRHKQLLKSGIQYRNFEKTFCSSPHWSAFEHSYNNQGHTQHMPTDIQIDLGNTCNSSCIMCNPTYSSRLARDYKKLHKISPALFVKYAPVKNWADDPQLVDKFIDGLLDISGIKYIHFLGGETLYLESFYTICERIIERGISGDIIVGTTTNGTVYNSRVERIAKHFKEFHVGVSIETVDQLNDYVRYPANTNQVLTNIEKFKQLSVQLTLRITPSVLTIYRLPELFHYMLVNNVIAESCNILSDPSCLRIELLPNDLREQVLDKIDMVIKLHKLLENSAVLNRRRQDLVREVITNLVFEYKQLLENIQPPADSEQQRANLVEFLQAFEQLRGNSILDCLPEYEEFLRSYGY